MSDINLKRVFVSDLYPSRGWKHKVARMSDTQVIAIFLREQKKATETTKSKEESDDSGDIPF